MASEEYRMNKKQSFYIGFYFSKTKTQEASCIIITKQSKFEKTFLWHR
jgi:hypothetical protein